MNSVVESSSILAHGRVLGACVFANHRQRPMSEEARWSGLGERARRAARTQAVAFEETSRRICRPRCFHHRCRTSPGSSSGHVTSPPIKDSTSAVTCDVVAVAPARWLLVIGDVTGHARRPRPRTAWYGTTSDRGNGRNGSEHPRPCEPPCSPGKTRLHGPSHSCFACRTSPRFRSVRATCRL
jgi:hypothetical protein